jgi:aryl-alcohol dehydrogenase
MRTTVAVVNAPGQDFTFEEVDLEGPRADEVLVRIVATGLCHTDITMRTMLPAEMFPNVFGHEGAGVVEEVGADVSGIEVGDHVVLSLRSCRACPRCDAGLVGYCDSSLFMNYMGMRMDGSTTMSRDGAAVFGSFFGQSSFAQHALAYADNCVVVDRSLDLTKVAPYGCGFQTGAGAVLNVLQPGPDDSLVVYGVGAVGLAAIAAARAQGVGNVIAVDLMASRLEVAARYGATVVNPGDLAPNDLGTQLVDQVKELTGGGATAAIDTTAVPEVIKQAAQSLGVRGELVILGLGAPEFPVDAIDIMQNGKVIRGSVEGDSDPLEMVPRLIELNRAGKFDVDGLLVSYPFTEINSAIADVSAGKVVKPVLVW